MPESERDVFFPASDFGKSIRWRLGFFPNRHRFLGGLADSATIGNSRNSGTKFPKEQNHNRRQQYPHWSNLSLDSNRRFVHSPPFPENPLYSLIQEGFIK